MNLHNSLVELAENNFEGFKRYESKIFEKEDYQEYLCFSILLLQEAQSIEKNEANWNAYNARYPNKFLNQKYLIVKRSIYLGIGAENLFKAIYLIKNYGINKYDDKKGAIYPYKLDTIDKTKINPAETIGFEMLKQGLSKVIELQEFDEKIFELNEKNKVLEQTTYTPKNIIKKDYKKPNSIGVLNLLQGIRNNYTHNVIIKSEFKGFFRDCFSFLDFITKKVFRKNIGELYEDYKPEVGEDEDE